MDRMQSSNMVYITGNHYLKKVVDKVYCICYSLIVDKTRRR